MQVWSVESEIYLNVTVLLISPIFELFSKRVERHRLGFDHPSLVELALLLRHPNVPKRFELVAVVFVKKIGGALHRFFRTRPEVVTFFKDAGLIERQRMHRKIAYAW